MGVERTCCACERSGDSEYHELVLCDVDSHGFGSDAVISYRHDSTAVSGLDKVLNDEQCKENEDNAHGEVCVLRCARDTLSALDDDVSVSLKTKLHGALGGEMPAVGVNAEVDDVYHVLDYLAECQCYDSKVVAFKTENGDSDQYSEDSCKKCTYKDCKSKSQGSCCNGGFCKL